MPLERDFERYEGGPVAATQSRTHVTIYPRDGTIFLNANMHRAFGRPEAVSLHYSRQRDTIAIGPEDPSHPKAFPIKPSGTGFRICAAPFLRHYRITIKNAQRFFEAEVNADGYLILALAKTVNIGFSQKKKRN